MFFFTTIIFFIFGLIIGSFLNVVILRLNTAKSLGGRSACMSCQNTLSWYELIPLFSFLGLRGRCRMCKSKISIQYPLVELTTSIVFASLLFKFSLPFDPTRLFEIACIYIYYACMFSILIVIAGYDVKHKIIPDVLSYIFTLLAFCSLFFLSPFGIDFHIPSLLQILSGVLIAFPFAILAYFELMGFGDVKLIVGLGYFLGLSVALSAITLAFWIGAVMGIGLVIFNKKYGWRSQIPFAVYLLIGVWIAFIFNIHLFPI